MLIALSGSGKSANIINAINEANLIGIKHMDYLVLMVEGLDCC